MSDLDLATLKAARDTLEASYFAAGRKLKSFPKHDNGLTPDSVKETPEWKMAKSSYEEAFSALQRFNKRFAKQLRAR